MRGRKVQQINDFKWIFKKIMNLPFRRKFPNPDFINNTYLYYFIDEDCNMHFNYKFITKFNYQVYFQRQNFS